MTITLEIAYTKLKTKLIKITPIEPKGKSTTTHDHEIDDDNDLVAYLPDDDTNLAFMCNINIPVQIEKDHLLVRNQDGILFKIQFLETKPISKLEQRILL